MMGVDFPHGEGRTPGEEERSTVHRASSTRSNGEPRCAEIRSRVARAGKPPGDPPSPPIALATETLRAKSVLRS